MLAPGYPWSVNGHGIPMRPVEPYSDRREDWISFGAVSGLLPLAAKSGHPSLVRLLEITIDLKESAAWHHLEGQRDLAFHRAREESPVAIGTRRAPVWQRSGPGQRTLSGYHTPDLTREETIEWVEPICDAPRGFLNGLAPFMVQFREAIHDVIAAVTGATVGSTSVIDLRDDPLG
jgi:hypothetical protein